MHKLLFVACAAAMLTAQTGRSVMDAVYAPAQAERGRARYERTCEPCHGVDLHGGVGAALTGESFVRNWSGLGLDRLADRVRMMPPNAAERLGDAAALELVAYLLSANGFPAGTRELEADGIDRIRIEQPGDAASVPDFSLVAMVGCLARGDDREWIVTRATDPVRTKNPDASAGDDQIRAAASTPGPKTYKLLNVYPSPEKFEGHMVETKGFLIRGPVDSVNVTALSSLATACPR